MPVLAVGCGEPAAPLQTRTDLLDRARPAVEGELIAWERVRTYDEESERVLESGTLDYDAWLAAAGGLPPMAASDGKIYSEEAGDEPSKDGRSRIDFHRISYRLQSATPERQPEARVSPEVVEELLSDDGQLVTVDVQPPPIEEKAYLTPPVDLVGSDEVTRARGLREVETARVKTVGDAFVAQMRAWATGNSARIVAVGTSGNITMEMPQQSLENLLLRDDLGDVSVPAPDHQGCDSTCPMVGASDWKTGEGRSAERLGTQTFIDDFYTGERSNSGRHSFGDITIAFLESAVKGHLSTPAMLDDESCFLGDGTDDCSPSTYRNKGMFACDVNGLGVAFCSAQTDFDDDAGSNEVLAYHANAVLHAGIADLEDNQAQSWTYGDACYLAGHCDDWELASSGQAPEAGFLFYGTISASKSKEPAIANLRAQDVDISNSSWGSSGGSCDITSSTGVEDEFETAYDYGVFNVANTGNEGTASCTMWSPADLPKMFSVGSVTVTSLACENDYTSCPFELASSRTGGGFAVIDGLTYHAVSMVDLLGPNDYVYRGSAQTEVGTILDSAIISGSSVAAPHVAGAAALLKDYHLSLGDSWINSPGRLHTLMLGMGDRWDTTGRRLTGDGSARFQWGFGRLKMRLFKDGSGLGPYGWNIYSTTLTPSSSSIVRVPFSNPMPSGTELAKCVLYEGEDMSSKSDVGDVYLKLEIREPVSGSCSSSGALVSSISDVSYDLKHFAAVEGAAALEGHCVVATLQVAHVAANTGAHLFCYYSGVLDDEPS